MRGPDYDITPAQRQSAKLISTKYREQNNLTQEKFAQQLGLRMMSISEIERGSDRAPSQAVKRILELGKEAGQAPHTRQG